MKIIKDHIEEVKKYPQKLLILVGLIVIIIGLVIAPDNAHYTFPSVAHIGVSVAVLGLILYLREIFPH